jgi:hypothetical protein
MKNHLTFLKHKALLVLCFCFCMVWHARSQAVQNWTKIYDEESLVVNYRIEECGGKNQLAVMVVNNSTSNKRVVVKLEVTEGSSLRKLPEGVFHVPANSQVVVDCNSRIPHLQPLKVVASTPDFVCSLVSVDATAQ